MKIQKSIFAILLAIFAFSFASKSFSQTYAGVDTLTLPSEFAQSGPAGFVVVTKSTLGLHSIGGSALPTIASGTGAGTSPTLAINAHSTDTVGQITLTAGSSPAVSSAIATVTFNQPYATAPFVTFSPANAATAALTVGAAPYVTSTANGFTLTSNGTALTAAGVYAWNYSISQQ
jgi:hypothetical protein